LSDSLDVIIVDDDPYVCEVLSEMIKEFYVWGDVMDFSDSDEAIDYCSAMDVGVAIFVLDVFLGNRKAFSFLDAVVNKFPMAHEDTIMITGKASDEVVDACIASDITCLLEKPVRPYALQLAVRAIVTKYLKFAKRILSEPSLAAGLIGG